MTEQKARVFVFGPWMDKKPDGTAEMKEEGKLVADWMRNPETPMTDELANLLRLEIKAEKDYRNLLVGEINLLRTRYLDEANRVVPELMKPYRTVVEAYNNGMKMGEHQAGVKLTQWLADVMDKLHVMEVVDDA